jgi:hypothetical protein
MFVRILLRTSTLQHRRAVGRMERDSPQIARLVVGPVRLDEGEQGDLGHEAAPAEADDGKLAPGNQLVGRRPG